MTVSNSCNIDTFCDSIEVEQNTSSLTENWEDALMIYPNSAESTVHIQGLPKGVLAIELRNVLGQVVYETTIANEGGVEVPVSQLSAGHYNLIVRSESVLLQSASWLRNSV